MATPTAPAEPVAYDPDEVNIRCTCCGVTAWAERPDLIAAHNCEADEWFSFVVPEAVAA